MIIKNASYIKGASKYEQCIVSDLVQVAVAGKSNVGKSSFINYLVNDGKLARTSKLPGRTRLINYFLINDGANDELCQGFRCRKAQMGEFTGKISC